MNDTQDAASYAWPPLTPAEYLEDELVFCRDGSSAQGRDVLPGTVRRQLLGGGGGMTDRCDCPSDECREAGSNGCAFGTVFIPRALRCACTDTHHYRGSALCPLTPVDPWGVDA